MRAESFFHFAGYIDELARETGKGIYRSYGGKSLHSQSHGEAFLSLFNNRIGKKGVYLLDEPEAALSPQRQLALLGILDRLEKSGEAQVIIATHSPLLMAFPRSKLLMIRDGEISEERFRSTTHYQILARFFANPEKYVADFLDS
jgi:predicted ATPase